MLARQLNVAGQVVEGGSVHSANTAGSTAGHESRADHQLDLTEDATGGGQSLAHILEDGVTRSGHIRGGNGALGVHVCGDQGSLIRASVDVHGGTAISDVDVVSSVGRDLFGERCQRAHLLLYPCRRK